jgi:hypothetical protein
MTYPLSASQSLYEAGLSLSVAFSFGTVSDESLQACFRHSTVKGVTWWKHRAELRGDSAFPALVFKIYGNYTVATCIWMAQITSFYSTPQSNSSCTKLTRFVRPLASTANWCQLCRLNTICWMPLPNMFWINRFCFYCKLMSTKAYSLPLCDFHETQRWSMAWRADVIYWILSKVRNQMWEVRQRNIFAPG